MTEAIPAVEREFLKLFSLTILPFFMVSSPVFIFFLFFGIFAGFPVSVVLRPEVFHVFAQDSSVTQHVDRVNHHANRDDRKRDKDCNSNKVNVFHLSFPFLKIA